MSVPTEKTLIRRGYRRFGSLQISIDNLYNNKKLMVSLVTGSPCTTIKNQKISDDLATILIDLLEQNGKNEIDENIMGRLSSSERDLLKSVLDRSGLRRILKIKAKPRTISQVVTRFEMLQGSIEAGNTAKEIIKEAVELLTILQAAGKISKEEADDFVDILNSI
jgi:hypothetical protein